MASIINTNINSLNAQRNLAMNQASLATTMQRLSSGLRINSAKDDAAGLAISDRFTTQIKGLNQAARNANDGISLSQTAEGALGEVSNNLQRIRELAVQSANATNSASDRAALDQEVQQRLAEIDRVAAQTSFNGQKVLDGTFGNATFQVGANVGDTIGINLSTSMRATQLGHIATASSSNATGVGTTALSGSGTIQVGSATAVTIGASVAGTAAGQSSASAYSKAIAISAAGVSGLSVTASNHVVETIAATTNTSTASSTYSLNINGTDIFASYDQNAGGVLSPQQVADAINAQSTNTGVTAALSGANLLLTAADGRDINIGQTIVGGAGGISAGAAATFNGQAYQAGVLGTAAQALASYTGTPAAPITNASTNSGQLTFVAQSNISIVGDAVNMGLGAAANATIALDTVSIATTNVLTVAGSNNTIQRVDSALTSVSSLRSTFGAIQNRFESVIANLSTTAENLTASRSRIQDADFAVETANLSRSQILQQAGTAMVAQANQLPQGVLQLLK